jgi:acyl-coenzyme A synthetase/AMP-(fatty) acid ligase
VGGAICITDFERDGDPEETWNDYQRVLASHAVSWAFFVPDQIRAFVKIVEQEGFQPAGAETVLVMGAPISGEEKSKAARLLRSKVVESWGNSESLGTITESEDLQTRPNSIGRPFITDELYVLSEDEKVAEPGETGRLAGSDVEGFLRYSNRPKETRLVKRSGMIISDDMGYMDADGYFYIRGREQECVIRGSRTIFLGDIEKKLRETKQIGDCCVIAKPVNEGVLTLVAVIILAPGVLTDLAILLGELNKVLPPHMKVDQILVRNELPYLPSGKQDKVQVARLIDEVP